MIVTLLAVATASQRQLFGNLAVDWSQHSIDGRPGPKMVDPSSASTVRPLPDKSIEELKAVLHTLGVQCDRCQSQPHWVSAVRHFILTADEQELQKLLRQRGTWCEHCTQLEQWRDRAMAVVHMRVQ
mmetsp:Transcript_6930/g.20145  ORF Transcript_6930/g.20145 Transcript_6930/m.20145 type:complete len:127 (+) Transcript_6930:62-442(+)